MSYLAMIEAQWGRDHTPPSDSGEIQYNCPFCKVVRNKADRDYKMYVNIKSGFYHCFKCNSNGKFKYDKEQAIFSEKLGELRDIMKQEEIRESYPYILPALPAYDHPRSREYLHNRGISKEYSEYYSLRYASILENIYSDRVIVPNQVKDYYYSDMLVARAISNKELRKYINPTNSPKKRKVFNLHNIKKGAERLIITEGVFSAIRSGREAVALYGKIASKEQLKMILAKKPKEIYIILDPDAQKEAQELTEELSRYLSSVYWVPMKGSEDPADLGEERVNELIKREARRLNKYSFL